MGKLRDPAPATGKTWLQSAPAPCLWELIKFYIIYIKTNI